MATKSLRKKTPPESARAGEDDDSPTDYMASDPGMKQTTRMMINKIPEMMTHTPGIKLQSCRCGWTKETSYAGLRRHQGLKKCLLSEQQGPCIDRYFLRSRSNKSSEVQQQDQNQSLQDINPPVREEDEEPSIVVPPQGQPATVYNREQDPGGQNPVRKRSGRRLTQTSATSWDN